MKTEFKASFLKSVKKIRDGQLKEEIATAILQVEEATDISSIASVIKLKGYREYYRIRLGDHRIGLRITGGIVYFVEIAHRKDIYKLFP
ncbi:MAG: type II toxin-antitoxin system RelE/ParE family toxin [Lentimicrobium sp.]